MHPAPAGQGEPVLVYRPGAVKELSVVSGQLSENELSEKSQPPAPGLTTDNRQSTTDNSSSASSPSTLNSQLSTSSTTLTPLPDIVSSAIPSLHCTTGTAARIDRDDDVTLHIAFFEWDLASSTNVLEAFKHLPEECMGSIGMTLIAKAPPRAYVVAGQGTGDGGREAEIGDQGSGIGGQEEADAPSFSSTQQSTIDNHQSSISSPNQNSTSNIQNSKFATQSLSFDHTVFRDPRGVIVHAFKGTWVSGATDLLGAGVRGGVEQWNQIRLKAGLKRFRPAHARVVQGAVRGIPDPDLAWEAFEQAMLKDLSFR